MKITQYPLEQESIASGHQYEFTPGQNSLFRKLVHKMRWFGGGLMLVGLFEMAHHLVYKMDLLNVFLGGIMITIGALTFKVSGSFLKIIKTEGNDIDHLMEAILQLHRIYRIKYWLILIGLAMMLLVAIMTDLFFNGIENRF